VFKNNSGENTNLEVYATLLLKLNEVNPACYNSLSLERFMPQKLFSQLMNLQCITGYYCNQDFANSVAPDNTKYIRKITADMSLDSLADFSKLINGAKIFEVFDGAFRLEKQNPDDEIELLSLFSRATKSPQKSSFHSMFSYVMPKILGPPESTDSSLRYINLFTWARRTRRDLKKLKSKIYEVQDSNKALTYFSFTFFLPKFCSKDPERIVDPPEWYQRREISL